MASPVKKEVRIRVKNYKRALRYLNRCGEITLEKLQRVNQIAGLDMPEAKLRSMMEQADFMLSDRATGRPGGREALRYIMRESLEEGIDTFSSLSKKL